MASQMGFAFSANIKGVGQFGAPAYYCADGDYSNVGRECLNKKYFDIDKIQNSIEYFEKNGYIDNTNNLETTKVFMFGGTKDKEVPLAAVEFAEKVWRMYTSDVAHNYSIPADHNMVTDFYGYRCNSV